MKKNETSYLYEMAKEDALLDYDEEQIMKKLRSLNILWRKYKNKPNGNKLILYCGGAGCSIRYGSPSVDSEIEAFPYITCDGGDGGDSF